MEPLPTVGEHDNRSGDDYYDDGTYDEVVSSDFSSFHRGEAVAQAP